VAHVYARRVVARAREAIGQVVDWAVVPPHEETVGRITVLANPCGDLNRSRILQRALPDESAHEPVACPEERGEEREERESAARSRGAARRSSRGTSRDVRRPGRSRSRRPTEERIRTRVQRSAAGRASACAAAPTRSSAQTR